MMPVETPAWVYQSPGVQRPASNPFMPTHPRIRKMHRYAQASWEWRAKAKFELCYSLRCNKLWHPAGSNPHGIVAS